MDLQELGTALDVANASLDKIFDEVAAFKLSAAAASEALQNAITALEAELANAGTLTPEMEAKVLDVVNTASAIDQQIEDLPSPPPAA